MTDVKTCTRCKTEQPLGNFVKKAKAYDGLYHRCRTCKRIELAQRMFVGGKYISSGNPLHKPGNYKTFADAWSYLDIEKVPSGSVYIISNPAWVGWYKVGKAVNSEDRLRGYQTGSPYRDYDLMDSWQFDDRHKAEREVHKILKRTAVDYKGEWFYTAYNNIVQTIEAVNEKLNS